MADVPVQLVVAAFDDAGTADEALKGLKTAKRERLVGIESAAVLRKDDKGKLHIKETTDMGPTRGAAIGGALGAGIALIAETALAAPLVVGGLLGALAAKLRDSGFENDRLERLGKNLPPDSSVIVAVVEHTWVDEVRKALASGATDVLTEELGADIADQLQSHHDATYTALQADGSLTLGQQVADDAGVEGAVLTADQQGVTGGAYTATDDGIAVAAGGAEWEREAGGADREREAGGVIIAADRAGDAAEGGEQK